MQISKKTWILVILFLAAFLATSPLDAGAQPSPRIVGGAPTVVEKWPYLVSIVERGKTSSYTGHFCGGALIRPRIVLTAAHCAEGLNSTNTDIVWKRENLKTTRGKRVPVVGVRVHPMYSAETMEKDLALLRIGSALQTKRPLLSQATPSGNLHVAGWGAREFDFPARLQEVSVPYQQASECQRAYNGEENGIPLGYGLFQAGTMFCAGDEGRDSCQGDSGGPIIKRGAGHVLYGVVSWGAGCGEAPGVYAKLDASWISSASRALLQKKVAKRSPGRDLPFKSSGRPMMTMSYYYSEATDPKGETERTLIFDLYTNYSLLDAEIKLLSDGSFCNSEECVFRGGAIKMTSSSGNRLWSTGSGQVSGECLVYLFRAQFPAPHGWKQHRIDLCEEWKSSTGKRIQRVF